MRFDKLAAIAVMGSCVAACGGGDGGGDPKTAPPGTTTYAQSTPVVGATDVYVTAQIDDSANTINAGYTQRVASVAADGSYTLTQVNPLNNSVTVNGVLYRVNPTTLSFDGQAHEKSDVQTLADGSTRTCTFSLQSGGHEPPWWVGQTFTLTVDESCTGASPGTATIVENGDVVSIESVTVPAGTFTALKTTSTETTTASDGEVITATISRWSDPAHSLFLLKSVTTYARSGVVATHYVNSETIELSSRSST